VGRPAPVRLRRTPGRGVRPGARGVSGTAVYTLT